MFHSLKTYFSIFTLLVGSSLFAQLSSLHPILSSFSVSETNGQVYISCTIAAGNTCNGINVFRSTDSINYEVVGRVGGVCGSLTEPVTYDFSDERPPKNKKVYYKLGLGGFGHTNTRTIEVSDLGNSGYSVYPNPANESAKVEFSNKEAKLYQLILYNREGLEVLNKQTNRNYFTIETVSLASGFYSFLVVTSSNNQRFYGKIVVEH